MRSELSILLIFLFVSSSLCVPQIPQQFYAETNVVTTSDGVVESEQHDFIWYDSINNKLKVITVDDIFGTNSTHIYRGDLQREYYIMDDMKCSYHYAPSVMREKLMIRENTTYQGNTMIDGAYCQMWVYSALNEQITYYLRDNGAPFKVILESGNYVNLIKFVQFKTVIPDRSAFELKNGINCEEMVVPGIKNPSREDVHKYYDAKPMLISPPNIKENAVEMEKRTTAIDPATLVLIGKTLWAIIKENKPVANLESNLNAVVPNGTTWTDMSGWRQQKWPGWQWTLVNGFGATTVDYKWSFNYLCNGNYRNIGKYIENAAAFPSDIQVLWGYTVNVKGQVLNPFNYGSTQSPVAGLTLSMTMDSVTIIKKITQNCLVNLIGDCSTQLVTCNGYKVTQKFKYVH